MAFDDLLKKAGEAFESAKESLGEKLEDLKEAAEENRELFIGSIRMLAAAIDDIKKSAGKKDAHPGSPAAGDDAPSESQTELVLIKDRNRLTGYGRS